MKIKQLLLIAFLSLHIVKLTAQVNLQKGTLHKSIPIYAYKNPGYSDLGVDISLEYSSGNGLVIDAIPGSLGTGWDIKGIAKIVRIQKGIADDQTEVDAPNFYNYKRPPGYIYNASSGDRGCPVLSTKYPIFTVDGYSYYEHNATNADREIDEFRLELNDKIIPFILNKNGGDCITLDGSKIKITHVVSNANGNVVSNIGGFIVIDETGTKYEFGEAEVYRSFVYVKDEDANLCGYNIKYLKAVDPATGAEYIANAWYVSKISSINECDQSSEILFEYNTQIYDHSHIEMKHCGFYDCPGGCPTGDDPCQRITVAPPPPYNLITKAYFYGVGSKTRNYVIKKEIKTITIHGNEKVEFEYNAQRKDLTNVYSLTQINVSQNNVRDYSFVLNQNYFIKNEIRQPVNAGEEKWSRLCLSSVTKQSGDGSLQEKPYTFDYYTGSNNTEDLVPPPFFHAKDPFGYYNGNFSGVPTDRILEMTIDEEPNWAKVCSHNYATINHLPNEIVYNPKPNYAKNGLLKSTTYPTGGKELYDYEQIYVKPTIQDYNGLTYRSFTTRLAPDNSVEYAYGGVSVSKISFFSMNNVLEKEVKYDYSLANGTSSLWGAENGRSKSVFTNDYEPEHKIFNPFNGQCSYEFVYPAHLMQRPSSASPASQYPYVNIFNLAVSGISTAISLLSAQSIIGYVIQYVLVAVVSCTDPLPQPWTEERTSFYQLNTNTLPVQYGRTKVTENGSGGLLNGYTVHEFTTPDDFPLLIPFEAADLTNKPRCYYWMYGLPKKTTVYDNTQNRVMETENTYSQANSQVLTSSSTNSCNCTPSYLGSMRNTNWLASSNINDFVTSSTSDIKVDFYNIATGRPELTSSKERLFKNSITFEKNTSFFYNSANNQIARILTTDSKGKLIERKTYYVSDYNLNNPSNSVLNQLKNKNAIGIPISTETWQTKTGTTPELLNTSITEFETGSGGAINPKKIYELEADRPVSQGTIGVFDPNQLIRNTAYIKPFKQINYLDCISRPKEEVDINFNGVINEIKSIKSFLYRYPDNLPIAIISNAYADECGYIPLSDLTTNSAFFSKWALIKASTLTFLTDNEQAVKVNIGTWNGMVWAYNDISPKFTTKIDNDMTYVEFDIPPGNIKTEVRNTSSCKVNELRFYPKNAFMRTVNYDAAGRKISECDINNRITYYEYDGLGRISKILDDRHNIIKTYEYHFKN